MAYLLGGIIFCWIGAFSCFVMLVFNSLKIKAFGVLCMLVVCGIVLIHFGMNSLM